MNLVKNNRPEFLPLKDLAARVDSGSRISVGGHHFARLPIALVRAVCAQKTQDLRYFNWAGGLPLELLLEAGAVKSIDICFSSLDIFGLAPKFRKAVESGEIPMTDWPALALIQSLRATEQNLPFLPMQSPEGSELNNTCPALVPYHDAQSNQMLSLVRAMSTDVFLLHAPRADENGNVELYGAHSLDKLVAGAAGQVLVTVEEIIPAGTLQQGPRNFVIPRNRISAISKVPGGAYPCSCLPYYTTDYRRLMDIVFDKEAVLFDELAPSNEGIPPFIRQAASLPARCYFSLQRSVVKARQPEQATVDELMTIRVARLLDNNSYASAGAVSPLANVAYRLAKRLHAPDLILTTFSGGTVDVDAGTLSLTMLEAMDTHSAVSHTGGEDTYWNTYQGSLVSHEIVGTAQIDAQGFTNTLSISKPDGGQVRLPGQGGMADVANMHQHFIVYVPRHNPNALVENVEICSAGRSILTEQQRLRYGYRPGKVALITNLCLFEYDEQAGQFVVTETMPGASREEIVRQTGFKVIFADNCKTMAEPTAEELRVLRTVIDPLGIRRLEFVSAKERQSLIREIISADRKLAAKTVEQEQQNQ
ncbi:CoA-transferase [Parasalinivibrio latis]|uniref:CoA-transferase n=1 Tax=Parasalinivibrio latis TaxID=2952610 RepID=UPI0030E1925F